MENILGNIFCWFQSFFGQELSWFLWGFNPITGGYTSPNIYNTIGLIILAITIVLLVIFYLIFNHPRLCKWWSWLLTMGINGVIALFVGYGICFSKYSNGEIPDELMYVRDDSGNIIRYLITPSHCWGFGIASIFVSVLFFIVLTFAIKWLSKNAKYVPF